MSKKNAVAVQTVVPEVVDDIATWQKDDFKASLVKWANPSPSLNSVGKILFYHRLAMETGKVSIAAALMTAIEIYKAKLEHPGDFVAWCDSNLHDGKYSFGYDTANRYLKALSKSVGRSTDLYQLANDTQDAKVEAVFHYTKYTNYQSLYELYKGEGIVAKSKLGGSRVKEAEANGKKVGRPRKDSQEALAAAAEQQAAELGAESIVQRVGDLYTAAVIQGGIGNCKSEDLKNIRDMLKHILGEAEEILKSRKAK